MSASWFLWFVEAHTYIWYSKHTQGHIMPTRTQWHTAGCTYICEDDAVRRSSSKGLGSVDSVHRASSGVWAPQPEALAPVSFNTVA